jgi:zinc finger SWIM domain-containing protein 3
MNHMRQMQEKDLDFIFKYSLDAEGTLKNLFLSDAQSQLDYGVFGDVMVFDST